MRAKPNNPFKPWGLTKKDGFTFVQTTIRNAPIGTNICHNTDGTTSDIFETAVLNESWIFDHFTRGSYSGLFVGPDAYGGKNLRVGFKQPDGTEKYKTFSWPKAVNKPTPRQRAVECCRRMVRRQMRDFEEIGLSGGPVLCPQTGTVLSSYEQVAVHHKIPKTFRVIFENFMQETQSSFEDVTFDPGPKLHDGPVDAVMGGEDVEEYDQQRIPIRAREFEKYHLEVAELQLVCAKWHKSHGHR